VRVTRTRRTYVIAAAVAAIVTAANGSQGAYFSQSWGWVALAFLVPTTVLLILDRVETPGRLRAAFAALMVALGVWIALSSLWSISTSASIREVERMLVYVAVALAVALVLRRGDRPAVLAGVALGVTLISTYALATRLFPDRLDTYDDSIGSHRLAEPLGYWNSLGLLAAIGALVTLGFCAHARRSALALCAAAALPIMYTTLYFTFSRGAWGALAIGFLVALAVDPRRLRLLWTSTFVALPSAVCIAYASRFDALTTENAPAAAAERDGHRVAAVVCVAIAVSVGAAWAARAVSRRVAVSRRRRRTFDVALTSLAVLAVGLGLVSAGGPVQALDGLKKRFDAEPAVGEIDLNERLFSISGNGRSEQLHVAWEAGRERPLLGNGAGSFEYIWYQRRPDLLVVRDAHSLYMETFTELGVVGVALLGGALLLLVVSSVRTRRLRFAATGLGAFCAWAAAATFDWHWEMVGVTLTGILAGAAGLVAAERGERRPLGGRARTLLVSVGVLLSVLAVWSLVGNQALFAGREALAREEWTAAKDHAQRARALLPWSYEPDLVLGDAEAGGGDRAGALRSYRDAVAADPRNWVAWLRLAQVARGPERAAAYRKVHELNPLEEGLPGE
jgi:O-antigen ligase